MELLVKKKKKRESLKSRARISIASPTKQVSGSSNLRYADNLLVVKWSSVNY